MKSVEDIPGFDELPLPIQHAILTASQRSTKLKPPWMEEEVEFDFEPHALEEDEYVVQVMKQSATPDGYAPRENGFIVEAVKPEDAIEEFTPVPFGPFGVEPDGTIEDQSDLSLFDVIGFDENS